MSMSKEELRRRGLNFARRQIAAGKATKQDIERWTKELGPVVEELAKEAAASKAPPPKTTKSDTKES